MIEVPTALFTVLGGLISFLGVVFAVFFYFQKPQVAQDKRIQTLELEMLETNKEIEVIKATHFENNGAMQKEMKDLTKSVNDLSLTVTKLSTIIDERIPKGSPNLTPPGK